MLFNLLTQLFSWMEEVLESGAREVLEGEGGRGGGEGKKRGTGFTRLPLICLLTLIFQWMAH